MVPTKGEKGGTTIASDSFLLTDQYENYSKKKTNPEKNTLIAFNKHLTALLVPLMLSADEKVDGGLHYYYYYYYYSVDRDGDSSNQLPPPPLQTLHRKKGNDLSILASSSSSIMYVVIAVHRNCL